ncbi:hypothetical protein ISCGN_024546 [Ixodes scapularis]
MRETTALPRLTPIPTLQEHAQLNTLTELVNQREQARILKCKHMCLHLSILACSRWFTSSVRVLSWACSCSVGIGHRVSVRRGLGSNHTLRAQAMATTIVA